MADRLKRSQEEIITESCQLVGADKMTDNPDYEKDEVADKAALFARLSLPHINSTEKMKDKHPVGPNLQFVKRIAEVAPKDLDQYFSLNARGELVLTKSASVKGIRDALRRTLNMVSQNGAVNEATRTAFEVRAKRTEPKNRITEQTAGTTFEDFSSLDLEAPDSI